MEKVRCQIKDLTIKHKTLRKSISLRYLENLEANYPFQGMLMSGWWNYIYDKRIRNLVVHDLSIPEAECNNTNNRECNIRPNTRSTKLNQTKIQKLFGKHWKSYFFVCIS